jgi:lipopolysaccharide export system permease protein
LTNHARHQELTAMRVAGISVWRLTAPYFAVGLAFTLALFALNEFWVPKSVEAVEAILHRGAPSASETGEGRWHPKLHFHNARDGRFWSLGAFNLDTFEMRNPHVSWRTSDRTERSLNARRAVRTNESWLFLDVEEFTYRPTGEVDTTSMKTNALVVPEFTETPEQIKSEIRINQLRSVSAPKGAQVSLAEILNYLRLHPNPSPKDAALLQTQLHGRLAWPLTCLVVVLIAIPFGAVSARRNVFVGVASSIFVCFVFFILMRLGVALGSGNRVTPWVAAWLPNIAFGAAGLCLTARVR